MSWMTSLTKLRNFEIEELRKRLQAILDRRAALEGRLTALDSELARELAHAQGDAESGWYLAGFRVGYKQRRALVEADLRALAAEEAGARDALTEAFEALKKVEKISETAAAAKAKTLAQLETQALDEQALRRRAMN